MPLATPRLEACYFGGATFTRMASVLRYTAAQHCPTWEVQVRPIVPQPRKSALGITSHVANTQKMEWWARIVEAAPDHSRLLLMDADMMILRPLDDVWDDAFDLAYTTKPAKFPFNSGVVFLRSSERVRAFMRVWRDENLRMLGDRVHHETWRRRYGGINQAALGFALESRLAVDLALAQLPCLEWNCEDTSWASFGPITRIVHVKSALRAALFNTGPRRVHLAPLIATWRQLERSSYGAHA